MDEQLQPKTAEIPLAGGLVASLRPILPSDAPLLEEGFSNLSESSRFSRFGVGMDHLSNQELRYLTEVDHRAHVAWGALVEDHAAGVARYLVLADGSSAEVAVTVVDRFQRHGLGRELFQALVAVARHDQLESFRFEVDPSNQPVQRLIRDVAEGFPQPGSSQGEVKISDLPYGDHDTDLVDLIEVYRNGPTSS